MQPTTSAQPLTGTDTTPIRPGMGWGMRLFFLGPVIVTACILVVFARDRAGKKAERRPSGLPIIKEAPAFSMTERSDRTITNADLAGKVWVASFFFAECTGPCPTITQRMQTIQNSLRHHKDEVRLVSFTLDPGRDTTLALRKYADRYKADADIWWFLTGMEEAATHEMVEKGFLTMVQGSGKTTIEHGTNIFLMDRAGRIRLFRDGLDGDTPDAIVDAVEALLIEPEAP